jgi:FlaA1/EpsC-like NDP-sugar epimerase
MIRGQNVLITGGGSVGEALLDRFLSAEPNVIRVLDNNEPSLARLKMLYGADNCRFLAGDVRDRDRVERAMRDIDIVVHTAAMKHVDISEYNPFEAVKTNVLGLQNVIDSAIDTDVEKLVFTSSDKAVNPANTMGTTKLLGEHLTTAGNKYSGDRDLSLASVRFGNVINSSQSVVPIFHDHIRDGGPIKVTDDRMSRFFLTYDDIADLVKAAIEHANGGEVFIKQMDAIRITDLADAMIQYLAPEYGHDPDDIEIEMIGRRVGETLHEETMTEREASRARERGGLYAIPTETSGTNGSLTYDGLAGFEAATDVVRSSASLSTLDVPEIIDILASTSLPGGAR